MTPERRAEAQKAGSAFHLALAYIGVASIDEAFQMWASLPEQAAPAAISRWLDSMSAMTGARRQESRELAMAYYRLIRALHTGRTVANPWSDDEEETVTLGTLRSDFADLVEDATDINPRTPKGREMIERGDDEEAEPVESVEDSDGEAVEVDEVDESIINVQERDDADADEALRDALLVNLDHYRRKREEARSEKDLADARETAAAVSAASSQKGTLDGARGTLHSVERRDREAIGFVRISRTGTPCGFCAMLISRGLQLKYASRGAAERRSSDGDQYHPNCQCYAEPVFSEEQYNSDPRFALNKKYSELWPEVTKGRSGRDALNAWRRWIERGQYRDEKSASAPAA